MRARRWRRRRAAGRRLPGGEVALGAKALDLRGRRAVSASSGFGGATGRRGRWRDQRRGEDREEVAARISRCTRRAEGGLAVDLAERVPAEPHAAVLTGRRAGARRASRDHVAVAEVEGVLAEGAVLEPVARVLRDRLAFLDEGPSRACATRVGPASASTAKRPRGVSKTHTRRPSPLEHHPEPAEHGASRTVSSPRIRRRRLWVWSMTIQDREGPSGAGAVSRRCRSARSRAASRLAGFAGGATITSAPRRHGAEVPAGTREARRRGGAIPRRPARGAGQQGPHAVGEAGGGRRRPLAGGFDGPGPAASFVSVSVLMAYRSRLPPDPRQQVGKRPVAASPPTIVTRVPTPTRR